MVSRKITKELATFLRREVKAKSAEWGELYKLKRLTSVKTGLPNLPRLTILSEPWLSYIIAIKSGSEVRLYYYNGTGVLQHGDTFRNEETQILESIQKKSRRLYRYPTKKKDLSIVDITKEYDILFLAIWKQITRNLRISKKRQETRPVIKVVATAFPGIFNTRFEGYFIYIPLNSLNLQHIFVYYSFYFLLPLPIRKNTNISESLALRLYDSFKEGNSILEQLKEDGGKTFDSIEEWKCNSALEILNFLDRLCLYNTEEWKSSDFIALRALYNSKLPKVSRNNLHEVFCQISTITGNSFLSLLATILAFPLEKKCDSFSLNESEISQVYLFIQNGRIIRVHNFLKENPETITQGLRKAIREALQYWYSNVLDVSCEIKDSCSYTIRNKSDLTIFLDNAKLISSSGSKTSLDNQKHLILPDSKVNLSFSSYTKELDSIISLNYYLLKDEKNIGNPIFTGKIKLL
jgi:hypothetical protein